MKPKNTYSWMNPLHPLFDPLLPLYRARLQFYQEWRNLNHWAVQKLREWERHYYTPYEGERIDACMGKDVCIVESVDIRKGLVFDVNGRRHDLRNCVDPYGYSAAYVEPFFDENGDSIDPNTGEKIDVLDGSSDNASKKELVFDQNGEILG